MSLERKTITRQMRAQRPPPEGEKGNMIAVMLHQLSAKGRAESGANTNRYRKA
jgi:hypothetical protein